MDLDLITEIEDVSLFRVPFHYIPSPFSSSISGCDRLYATKKQETTTYIPARLRRCSWLVIVVWKQIPGTGRVQNYSSSSSSLVSSMLARLLFLLDFFSLGAATGAGPADDMSGSTISMPLARSSLLSWGMMFRKAWYCSKLREMPW